MLEGKLAHQRAPQECHGMSELREWLRRNNFEQYADAFEENDIDLDILPELSEHDLEQLGLSLGNRRRLLKAVAGRGAEAAAPTQSHPPAAGDAERRQVTVLFCDMVGSTALANAIDPELLGNLIRRYQDVAAGAIGRFGGFVAKFMGDGVLAYFGFPRAFEDAAERAVRAALDILAEIDGIELPDGSRARARIGIATGLVVVGEIVGFGTAQERTIVGETPNLAARLQALAARRHDSHQRGDAELAGRIVRSRSHWRTPIEGFRAPGARLAGAGRSDGREPLRSEPHRRHPAARRSRARNGADA
jgi:class 3 adenylate cyclase